MTICPHCQKEIKPKKKSQGKLWGKDSPEMVFADMIKDMIVCNHPALKEKLGIVRNRQKAAQAISDCLKEYKDIQIFLICQWVCGNDFWKKQFQSVMKLTRKDNGSTGLTLKWIKRFENEMKNDGRRSVDSISKSFEFTKEKKSNEKIKKSLL